MLSTSSRVSGWTASSGTSSISGSSSSGSGSGSGTWGSKLGSDQTSNPPTSRARIRSLGESSLLADTTTLDHLFAALAPEPTLSGFGHTAGAGAEVLLCGLHVAATFRDLGFELVAHQFGLTSVLVPADFFLDAFVRTFVGHDP